MGGRSVVRRRSPMRPRSHSMQEGGLGAGPTAGKNKTDGRGKFGSCKVRRVGIGSSALSHSPSCTPARVGSHDPGYGHGAPGVCRCTAVVYLVPLCGKVPTCMYLKGGTWQVPWVPP